MQVISLLDVTIIPRPAATLQRSAPTLTLSSAKAGWARPVAAVSAAMHNPAQMLIENSLSLISLRLLRNAKRFDPRKVPRKGRKFLTRRERWRRRCALTPLASVRSRRGVGPDGQA